MDQATASSWKLLPWSILGGSNKKPQVDRPPKKVSAFRKRLQAHAAIARSLSPFCARTSFDSATMPDEENKCLLSLSAFMNACSRCAFRDVQVTLAPVHSPHQQKAYIKAIHHHLQEPSYPSSSRRAHRKVSFGGAFDTEMYPSKEGHSSHQRDHHRRHTTPSKEGGVRKIEAYECNENEIKPSEQDKHRQLKQCREGEVSTRRESRHKRHGKSHHKQQVYSFDSGNINRADYAHHCTPIASSSSSKKDVCQHNSDPIEHAFHGTKGSLTSSDKNGSHFKTDCRRDSSKMRKAAQIPHHLGADLYVCTTAHVVEQHKGKMKTFGEGMHDYNGKQISVKGMHRQRNGELPILEPTHHDHAGTDAPWKSKHKSLETYRHARDNLWSLNGADSHKSDVLKERAHQRTSKHPSLSYLSFKEYNESNECFGSKDPSSLKCNESYANKNPSKPFKGSDSYASKNPLSLKGSESYVDKDPLPLKGSKSYVDNYPFSLKGSESYADKDLPLKVYPSPAFRDNEGSINDAVRERQDHERVKHMRLDHEKVSGGIWMQDTVPVVKYSHNPCRDFHSSMLEMLLGRGLKDLHELQDMFVCYILLNSPRNQKHIEKAFRDLLTDLYRCKLTMSLQVDESQRTKTQS